MRTFSTDQNQRRMNVQRAVFLVVAFCWSAIPAFSQSDLSPFFSEENQKWGYLDTQKNRTKIEATFDAASGFRGQLAEVVVGGNHALIKTNGKMVAGPVYEQIGWSSDSAAVMPPVFYQGVIGARISGLWGLLDDRGRAVKETVFAELYAFNGTLAKAGIFDQQTGKVVYGLINSEGNFAAEPVYQSLQVDVATGFVRTGQLTEDGQRYGLLDRKGRLVFPAKFRQIVFLGENSLGLQHENKLWGLYNLQGKPLYPVELQQIEPFEAGRAAARQGNRFGLLSPLGEVVEPFIYRQISYEDGKWHKTAYPATVVYNLSGEKQQVFYADSVAGLGEDAFLLQAGGHTLLFTPECPEKDVSQYSQVFPFEKGLAVVRQNDFFGAIDRQGNQVLSPVFSEVKIARNGLLRAVMADGRALLYDRQGKRAGPESWQNISAFSNGAALVTANGERFFAGADLQPLPGTGNYRSASPFVDGLAAVSPDKYFGIIDTTGRWIIRPYIDSLQVVNRHYFIFADNGYFGTVDRQGVELFKTSEPFEVTDLGDSYLKIGQSSKFGLLNRYGSLILPVEYDSISGISTDSMVTMYRGSQRMYMDIERYEVPEGDEFEGIALINGHHEKFFAAKIGNRYGFVDYLGRIRISNQFEDVTFFSEDVAAVKLMGRWGYISRLERFVVQPEYEQARPFCQGFAVVRAQGRLGLIDHQGNLALHPQYDAISLTETGNFLVRQGENAGLLSRQTYNGLFPRYQSVQDCGNGLAIVNRDGLYGVSKITGETVLYPEFLSIRFNPQGNNFLAREQQGDQ